MTRPLTAKEMKSGGFDPDESAGLFVGISAFYEAGEVSKSFIAIPYAVDDAVDLAHLFAVELGLISTNKVTLALSGEPVKPETRLRLDALKAGGARITDASITTLLSLVTRTKRMADPAGLLVVTFATHGFTRDGDWILAQDSLEQDLRKTAIPVGRITDDVTAAKAQRRIVIIDACKARVSKDRSVGDAEDGMSASFVTALAGAQGTAVLSATKEGGLSFDDDAAKNGVFTAQVLRGLKGAAAADERGFITPRTLAEFVDAEVSRWITLNIPQRAGSSAGITKEYKGVAERIPLAVNTRGLKKHKETLGRKERLLNVLKRNADRTRISGKTLDEVMDVLERGNDEMLEPLLMQLEFLDQKEEGYRTQFSEWWAMLGRTKYGLDGSSASLPASPPVFVNRPEGRSAPGWEDIQVRYALWLKQHENSYRAEGLIDEVVASGRNLPRSEVDLMYEAGAIHWRAYDLERAIGCFDRIADDPRARFMLVQAALRKKDVQSALSHADALKSLPGGEPFLDDAWFAIAMKLGARDRIALLEDLVNRYPKGDVIPNAYYALGTEYFAAHEVEKAVAIFKKLESEFPGHAAHATYGPPMQRLREYGPDLENLISRRPLMVGREYVQYAIGAWYYHNAKFETAAQWFRRSVDAFPASENRANLLEKALFSLGSSFFHAGKYGDAERTFADFLKRFPKATMREEAQWNRILSVVGTGEDPLSALALLKEFRARFAGRDIGDQALVELTGFRIGNELVDVNPVWRLVRAEAFRELFERSPVPDRAYWAGLQLHRELEAAQAPADELRQVLEAISTRFSSPPKAEQWDPNNPRSAGRVATP